MTDPITIDLGKLDNVRPNGDGSWQAACPMCRNEGSDKTGNHLRVYPSMAFSCAKYKDDRYHNRGVLVLAGTASIGDIGPTIIQQPSLEIETNYEESILTKLIKNYDYWINRGISQKTMEQFEGGIATSAKLSSRYVFPLRDRNGRIHGFTGRYIRPMTDGFDVPRWKHIGRKENWVFDRANTVKAIIASRVATLVEGIGCSLALREADIHGVIPTFGVVPSSQLLSLLIELNPRRIYVSLNNEPGNKKAILTGNEASNRTVGILSNFFSPEKIILRLPNEKDWMDCSIDERHKFAKEIYGRN